MLRIVAIVFLAALTTFGDLHGQEGFKDFVDEYYPREAEYTKPKPEYPQGVQVDAHEGDSLSLVAFYNSTGGPNTWTNRRGWLQAPVSDWHGISLDSSGRVIVIELDDNELSGTLPSEIGQLAHLEHLDIGSDWPPGFSDRYNRVADPIPGELELLTKLKTLDLSSNQFIDPIPDILLSLSDLQTLDLSDNVFYGGLPPWLGSLTSLHTLDLAWNSLSGTIPIELARLSELQRLDLRGNLLHGEIPPELGLLANLTELLLSSPSFTGRLPRELTQLTKLERLSIGYSSLTGGVPPWLAELGELRILWLYGSNLSGTIPPELARLRHLEALSLQSLNLKGSIPPELGTLSKLKTLLITDNRIEGEIPAELGQLDKLEELKLISNNLTGQIPPELGELGQLHTLFLQDNNLSGSIPQELGQLSRLWHLSLSENNLSGAVPQELAQISGLFDLSLYGNNLSGPVPDLTSLNRLLFLHVQDNQFMFADLLPNAALSRLSQFRYAPQDAVDTKLTCSSSEYIFTTAANAEGNVYQWYRNGEAIPGAESDTLRLSTASDLDEFHAIITNGALPDLTLISHKVSTDGAGPCTAPQYANAADSTLLVDFYNRTHGSLLWHTHTGWLEEPVAQWYGITLDASGRVTHVNLSRNNLVGRLPLSLLQLPHLRHLDVSSNKLSGIIPKGLVELTQLEYLDLSHNTLAGELPKELADQAPLKMLDVSGNQLVGAIPTELSQISTLQTFSVSANQLSGPVPAFTGLDQLDTLHVAQNTFLFMDLLPNAPLTRLDDFVYAPQDSVETLLTRTASGFALTTAAKAVGNRYQWYRDDQPISGPQSDTLLVSATSDPAQYHVTITNDRLPDLTLVSRKKGVHDGLTLTEAELPQDFLLHQSYPNPFAEATTVAFELGTPEHVRIVVYDLLGKAVATIADGQFTAGVHRIEFAADNLASGQYMYRMEAGAYRATRFMSVVR